MSTSSPIDPDGDSQMNIDTAPQVLTPSTPPHAAIPHDIRDLSPPNSQGGVPLPPPTSMPTVAASTSGANANGKRPLDTLDGSGSSIIDPATDLSASNISLSSVESVGAASGNNINGGLSGAGVKNTANQKLHTHGPSGYTWTRPEDAPGYGWQNRKAQDEANRAWETNIVAKDRIVQNRYGDPFDLADREAAMMRRDGTEAKVMEA